MIQTLNQVSSRPLNQGLEKLLFHNNKLINKKKKKLGWSIV